MTTGKTPVESSASTKPKVSKKYLNCNIKVKNKKVIKKDYKDIKIKTRIKQGLNEFIQKYIKIR